MVGKIIGGYEILELVGEGPNGSVWKAKHQELGKLAAIKVLPVDLALREADRERFVRGSKALARLDHPGIATVFAAEFSGPTPYIVSELVDGVTVNAWVASGPAPADRAIDLVLQAARALQYAHERGVIHRDISGGNIMITTEGRIKIVDFGLAVERDETRMTTQGTVLGTLPYMSPEALRDAPLHESRDTYALGVIFYQLLTARTPFMADSFERLAYLIVNTDADPPSFHASGLPASVDRLVLQLLEKNPKRRATNQRLISELQVIQASRVMSAWAVPTQTLAPSLANKVGRPIGKGLRRLTTMAPSQWRRLARSVCVAVGAIGALAWGAYRLKPEGPVKPAVASLAILPLFNENAEGRFDYIGNGLAEHLAGRLAGLDGLLVQPYRRTLSGDALEMTERLNVEGVLEGSFAVRGGDVLVRIDLVKRNGRRSTVAESRYQGYKRAAEELSMAVAERLKSRLTPREAAFVGAPAAGSNEAFDALSTAEDAHQRGERDEALRWYGRAASLDPGLAKAYVGLGSIYYDRYFRGKAGVASLEIAKSQFQQALALDPDNSGALRGLILVHMEGGERESLLAIADRVKASGASTIDKLLVPAWAYVLGGLPDVAVPLLKEASERDPQSNEALYFLVIAAEWSGEHEEAIAAGENFLKRFGPDPELLQWTALANWNLGREAIAASQFRKAIDLFHDDTQIYVAGWAARFFQDQGDRATAHTILTNAIGIAEGRKVSAPDNRRLCGELAGLYLLAGLPEKADAELAVLDSLGARGAFVGDGADWAPMAYRLPRYRERTIRFLKRLDRKNLTWRVLSWCCTPELQSPAMDPELRSIAAAARAYDDTLRVLHGLPPAGRPSAQAVAGRS